MKEAPFRASKGGWKSKKNNHFAASKTTTIATTTTLITITIIIRCNRESFGKGPTNERTFICPEEVQK